VSLVMRWPVRSSGALMASGKRIWDSGGTSLMLHGFAHCPVAVMMAVTFLPARFAVPWSSLADAFLMAEAVFVLLRFHVPKLCLGETHVPLLLLEPRDENASYSGDYPLCTPLVVAIQLR
jgi:hypothetical protein